ncbi:recombinase family protein [Streptomyces sp. NPDC057909]|uniref:recombinase family protein n=1 Tax=Streptomyces sp. NPDC057909 TaxID=3346277 RepID=UPI0036EE72AB
MSVTTSTWAWEEISTRVKVRPELEKALALAHQFKEAAPETPVIFTVHELKRLARNAAELMTLSAELQAGGIQLELLAGPLTGIYDPYGMGAMFFAVLAVAGQIERNYIREKTLEGQVIAASKGNHGGRPKVIDDDMLTFAVALKDKGVPVPDIAKKLTIKTGKNVGKSPSVASLYRALAEAEQAATDDGLPIQPKPVRIRHPADARGSRPSRTPPGPGLPAPRGRVASKINLSANHGARGQRCDPAGSCVGERAQPRRWLLPPACRRKTAVAALRRRNLGHSKGFPAFPTQCGSLLRQLYSQQRFLGRPSNVGTY